MNDIEVRLLSTGLWKIKNKYEAISRYEDMTRVFLHMLNAKVYEHEIMTCSYLYIYELGIHNRQIDIIKEASKYMEIAKPNKDFYLSLYSYRNNVYGKK